MLRRKYIRPLKLAVGVLIVYIVIRCIKQSVSPVRDLYNDLRGSSPANGQGQELIDYIAANLQVVYEPWVNGDSHRITLTNKGTWDIPAFGWKIYFSDIPGTGEAAGIKLHHVDGWLHFFEPVQTSAKNSSQKEPFKSLLPGGANITIIGSKHLKSRSYTFPRWYVTGSHGVKPRVIESTNSEELEFVVDVESFSMAERYRVNAEVADKQTRLKATDSTNNDSAGDTKCPGELVNNVVIPTPLIFERNCGKMVSWDKTWRIVYEENLTAEATYLSERLEIPMTKIYPEIDPNKVIILTYGDIKELFIKLKDNEYLVLDEAYILLVEENQQIKIRGHLSGSGVFYGIQSLLSLLEGSSDGHTLHLMRVVDAPRMPYRGLLLDVARGFLTKSEVMKTMDIMAMYKINKLHFHLTDDQGWRLEIPGLPELTEVGGKRKHQSDIGDKDALYPYLGSYPDSVNREYYTVNDYLDILRHAKRLHIEVIPEIDMPGHIHSAILSMRVRRRKLLKDGMGEDKASQFLISDPEDTSSYTGVNDQKDLVLNPCMNSTYVFVEHVIRAVIDIHKKVQPLRTFHIGGDEVPNGALTGSPICQKLKQHRPELKGTHDLKMYFMMKVVDILGDHGINVQAWEEGLGGYADKLPSHISAWNHSSLTLNAWNNGKLHPFTFANAGYKVVLSDSANIYVDHPSEPDFNEPGLFWATRSISTRKILHYIPASSRLARNGSFIHKKICDLYGLNKCIDMERPENIIGMQASLWGEMIRTMDQAEYMLYPRLLALAERAWHRAPWELAGNEDDYWHLRMDDWTQFSAAVGNKELMRLEKKNVHYRLPVPGAIIDKNVILVNTEFPGLPIEYSLNNKTTWVRYDSTKPLERTSEIKHVHLRTLSHDEKRKSRTVLLHLPEFSNKT